jgi:beta-xylosidase
MTRMKSDGTGLYNEGKFVFDGQKDHPTIEGPKMYKRNGFYYLFAPAGGVKEGWQVVLRSRDVFGPYEDRVVLHQGNTPVNGPHQGGWVELESGESWFLHFQDAGAYGRVVHLQPMEWALDWPLIGQDMNGDGIGEPVARHRKPVLGASFPICVPASGDDFRGDTLGLQWQWQANPKDGWYSLAGGRGCLRLYSFPLPAVEKANLSDAPNILTRKFPAPGFRVDTETELQTTAEGDAAGLIVYGDDYRSVAIKKTAGTYAIVLYEGGFRTDAKKWERETVLEAAGEGRAGFRLTVGQGAACRLEYSLGSGEFKAAGGPFAARPGKWVGAKVGIYCVGGANTRSEGCADFAFFKISS